MTGVALSFIRHFQSALKVIENNHSVVRRSIRSEAIQHCLKDKAFDLVKFEDHARSLQAHNEAALIEAEAESRAINALVADEVAENPHFKLGVPNCPPAVQLSYLLDISFVKRRLSKICHRERLRKEAVTKSIGGTQPVSYCSNDTFGFIQDGDKRNEIFLKNRQVLVKSTGETFCLLDLHKNKSKNKFNETYFIVKNLEAIAQEQNFLPFMLTLTAPARYHPNPLKGRCAFDAYSTVDSQNYLRRAWARFRSYLAKIGIPMSLQSCFGLRTAELHRDGCVHWHLILFINPETLKDFEDALAARFSSTQADIIAIDGCSTSTYALKYILKSVDLDDLPIDYTDDDRNIDAQRKQNDLSTITDAARVRAGIRAMAIRQIQYYGINSSLTKFRMINKITECAKAFPTDAMKILDECRINPRNGTPKNLLAYKNFLHKYSDAVELIHEETTNKHGLAGKKVIGIKFIASNYEYITKDKYEIITEQQKNQQPEAPCLATGKISSTANAVTLISIYPRKADRTSPTNFARPTASKLLKQARLLNPSRYMTPYLLYNAPTEQSETLTYAKICSLMSMS
ncbi:Bacteriophage replication protein GPA [compost metagenome]